MEGSSLADTPARGGAERDGSAERRSAPRYALVMKGLAEHAKLVGAGHLEVIASNVGAAGMLLHTDAEGMINEHDLLVASFVPLHTSDLVLLSVRVLWVKPGLSKYLGRVSFGCSFVDMPPARIALLLDPAREAAALRGVERDY